jgi:hypothetical protein
VDAARDEDDKDPVVVSETIETSRCRHWLRCREHRDRRTVHAGVAPVVVEDVWRLEALDDQ